MNPPRETAVAPPGDAPRSAPVEPPESLVNVCDARDCRFNDRGGCRAGAVSIALVRGAPSCATYSPKKPG